MWRADLLWKDPDAGKDWGQEEKCTTEEMVGWYHQLNEFEFDQTPGDNEGQGSLGYHSPWGCKELDTAEQLNKYHDKCDTLPWKRPDLLVEMALEGLLRVSYCKVMERGLPEIKWNVIITPNVDGCGSAYVYTQTELMELIGVFRCVYFVNFCVAPFSQGKVLPFSSVFLRQNHT